MQERFRAIGKAIISPNSTLIAAGVIFAGGGIGGGIDQIRVNNQVNKELPNTPPMEDFFKARMEVSEFERDLLEQLQSGNLIVNIPALTNAEELESKLNTISQYDKRQKDRWELEKKLLGRRDGAATAALFGGPLLAMIGLGWKIKEIEKNQSNSLPKPSRSF